jgi:hypothetical protein
MQRPRNRTKVLGPNLAKGERPSPTSQIGRIGRRSLHKPTAFLLTWAPPGPPMR